MRLFNILAYIQDINYFVILYSAILIPFSSQHLAIKNLMTLLLIPISSLIPNLSFQDPWDNSLVGVWQDHWNILLITPTYYLAALSWYFYRILRRIFSNLFSSKPNFTNLMRDFSCTYVIYYCALNIKSVQYFQTSSSREWFSCAKDSKNSCTRL